MALRIRLDAAGSVHGPIEVPEGFIEGVAEPTPLEVAAEFTRRLAEDHRALIGSAAPELGFRAPLTITVEEA